MKCSFEKMGKKTKQLRGIKIKPKLSKKIKKTKKGD